MSLASWKNGFARLSVLGLLALTAVLWVLLS